MARPKKPLEPLIPLDKLKGVVAGLLAVPKDRTNEAQPGREEIPAIEASGASNNPVP